MQFSGQCGKCGARRIDRQLGLEPTIAEYVANMVEVFRLVRDVLADDGVLWLNLGDSYATGAGKVGDCPGGGEQGARWRGEGSKHDYGIGPVTQPNRMPQDGLKPKDLCGIPWTLAMALRDPYYTGRIKRERDRVWLAAMIDGEGTICGFDHDRADNGSHRSGIHVAITNTNVALLDEAARIWPTSRSEHQRPYAGHLGTKTSWRWLVHGIHNKMDVLRELYPYLIAKKQQAIVAYSMLLLMADAKRLGHSSAKDETIAKRAMATALLSDLNHGRSVTLPGWLTAPPSLFEPGYYLRSDVIWSKCNPMPESVTDRPTKSHEYLFMLAKSERYFFDAAAIAEPSQIAEHGRYDMAAKGVRTGLAYLGQGLQDNSVKVRSPAGWKTGKGSHGSIHAEGREQTISYAEIDASKRNRRSVWTIATQPYAEAHFATFPRALVEPCIMAGSRPGDVVLDPFLGSGTVAMVAQNLGRDWRGCELSPEYAKLIAQRTAQQGLALAAAD